MEIVAQRGVTAAAAQLRTALSSAGRRSRLHRSGAMRLPQQADAQRASARLGRLLSSLSPRAEASESVGAAATAAGSPQAAVARANKAAAPPASGYRLPPPEIAAIVDTPPEPLLSFSPNRKLVLQLARPPANPPISELARPELKLAGGSVGCGCCARAGRPPPAVQPRSSRSRNCSQWSSAALVRFASDWLVLSVQATQPWHAITRHLPLP
jgi:hypothetical protein